MPRFVINENVERSGWAPTPSREPLKLHRRLPGYAATPLRRVEAAQLSPLEPCADAFETVHLKDETQRLTLPAFKVLGSSWAVYRELLARVGEARLEPWRDVAELRSKLRATQAEKFHLVTASDGNHGHGLARVARWLGLPATVFMPRVTVPARIEAIRSEGAEVRIVEGSYDEAVRVAADHGDPRSGRLLVQDTSWSGYERIPGRVIEGYATLLWEIDDDLHARGNAPWDLVAVPVGVGSLAAAVVQHFRRPGLSVYPRIVGVEAEGSACGFASMAGGRRQSVPEGPATIMAGLNCGTLATLAWPLLRAGMDAVIVVEDAWAARAVRLLARLGISAGASGAAGFAGLLALASDPALAGLRAELEIEATPRALTLLTEGVTDAAVQRWILDD